ncbi:hypothetical protein N7513_003284 [Penicillium frequentans]|uniref:Uncharacterized protein n=1 Tax=Penicillium frequentans TaxID=3151616 RepID=A0AAD6CI72_9EURO|nr:hypothetical protein N7494_013160 [Penicillium glabrum]KAJ5557698.1 hypothetical protein N7513_003284 [Penicillium glabrum]
MKGRSSLHEDLLKWEIGRAKPMSLSKPVDCLITPTREGYLIVICHFHPGGNMVGHLWVKRETQMSDSASQPDKEAIR